MISQSTQETRALARRLAGTLRGGENLCLIGNLGSGKTLFVQGLASGLSIAEQVKSPTYTYLREYPVPGRSTRLAHFDLYRLSDLPNYHELDTIELFERLKDPDVIAVVEWADKLGERLEGRCMKIEFHIQAGGRREILLPPELARLETT